MLTLTPSEIEELFFLINQPGDPASPSSGSQGSKPGGLHHSREKAQAHAVEPGVSQTVPLEKEEAFREPHEPSEPVEN